MDFPVHDPRPAPENGPWRSQSPRRQARDPADARKLAQAQRLLVIEGRDPIAERNARKAAFIADREAEKAKATTFRQCADAYIMAHQAGLEKRQARRPMGSDPGDLRLSGNRFAAGRAGRSQPYHENPRADLDDQDGDGQPRPWSHRKDTGPGQGDRNFATAKTLPGGLVIWISFLPKKSQVAPVEHFAALPYKQLPAFMAKLRKRDGVSARALEFTILNITRTANTIGAKWNQIDEKERTWTIPGELLKGQKGRRRPDHVIPLSDRAMAILEDLPREGDFVFPGAKEGEGLSNMAMAETLKEMGYRGDVATVHGFRSDVQGLGIRANRLCQRTQRNGDGAHVSNKVEAAYRRGDMREKRRRLMEDWATYCESKAVGGDNVVAIHAG